MLCTTAAAECITGELLDIVFLVSKLFGQREWQPILCQCDKVFAIAGLLISVTTDRTRFSFMRFPPLQKMAHPLIHKLKGPDAETLMNRSRRRCTSMASEGFYECAVG